MKWSILKIYEIKPLRKFVDLQYNYWFWLFSGWRDYWRAKTFSERLASLSRQAYSQCHWPLSPAPGNHPRKFSSMVLESCSEHFHIQRGLHKNLNSPLKHRICVGVDSFWNYGHSLPDNTELSRQLYTYVIWQAAFLPTLSAQDIL